MIPELFRIGDFAVSPFGVMMVLAFLACYFQLAWGFRRFDLGNEDDASAIVFAAGIGGIVGAKIYYALLYGDWRYLFDRAGLVWYGGFILAALLVAWVVHRRRLPFLRTADLALASVALGYGIGRVGCFLVGDDYGVPTDVPWAVTFPHGLPRTTVANLRPEYGSRIAADLPPDALVSVHPTQIYETALALLIWGLAFLALRRGARAGITAVAVLGALAVERFLVEFLRAKDDRFFGDLTLAQVISLALMVLALLLAWLWRRHRAGGEAAAGAAP